ncbi:MAG: hypothetical protein ACP5HI_04345 [Caldimicrobium sp.]
MDPSILIKSLKLYSLEIKKTTSVKRALIRGEFLGKGKLTNKKG